MAWAVLMLEDVLGGGSLMRLVPDPTRNFHSRPTLFNLIALRNGILSFKPSNDLSCREIHLRKLTIALLGIALLNAHGINPKHPLFGLQLGMDEPDFVLLQIEGRV